MSASIHEETARELLKEKLAEGRLAMSEAVKTMVIFLAVTSALLGFAIEALHKDSPDRELFNVLAFAGVGTALFFIVICLSERHIEKTLSKDIERLNQQLGSPLLDKGIVGLRGVYQTSLCFVPVAVIGWILLYIQAP